jgi:hypothetical protein
MTTQFLRLALASRRQSEQTTIAAANVVREAQRETAETMKRFSAQARAAAEAAAKRAR